jgi:hypothetical protein
MTAGVLPNHPNAANPAIALVLLARHQLRGSLVGIVGRSE